MTLGDVRRENLIAAATGVAVAIVNGRSASDVSFPGGVFSDFEMQQPTEAETALRNNPNRGPTSPEDYGHRIVNLTDGNMPVGRDRFVVLYGFDLLVAGSIVGYDGLVA